MDPDLDPDPNPLDKYFESRIQIQPIDSSNGFLRFR